MSTVRISPGILSGRISVPPSKSGAHRAVICAALSGNKCRISPIDLSEDIKATIRCICSLGASAELNGKVLTIDGSKMFECTEPQLDCAESGSTLRFLIPVAAAAGVKTCFTGHGKLPERPIGVFTNCLPENGVSCYTKGGLPLTIEGKLQSGVYHIPGDISSQFITGLMLALPMLGGDSEIVLTSPAQSVGYIEMTVSIMNHFGVTVIPVNNGWKIPGNQQYKARDYIVEGDWSQAAFFMTAGALGGTVTIDNLDMNSSQGDKSCLEIYRRFGADIVTDNNGFITISKGNLHGITINAENIPDAVPALAVAAAAADGVTVITGAQRLRIKECDRLAAMTDGLTRLGADIKETPDGLIIRGVGRLRGGNVQGYNDHRIVMSLACAAAVCDNDITITDMESINKSYPSFFEDFNRLGGVADVIVG